MAKESILRELIKNSKDTKLDSELDGYVHNYSYLLLFRLIDYNYKYELDRRYVVILS